MYTESVYTGIYAQPVTLIKLFMTLLIKGTGTQGPLDDLENVNYETPVADIYILSTDLFDYVILSIFALPACTIAPGILLLMYTKGPELPDKEVTLPKYTAVCSSLDGGIWDAN
jgi:hypothetical protein